MKNIIFKFVILSLTALTCSACSSLGVMTIEQSTSDGFHRRYIADPQRKIYSCEGEVCRILIKYEDRGSFFITDTYQFLSLYIIYNRSTKEANFFYTNSEYKTEAGFGSFKEKNISEVNGNLVIDALVNASPIYSQTNKFYKFTFDLNKLETNNSTKDYLLSFINGNQFIVDILNKYYPQYLAW